MTEEPKPIPVEQILEMLQWNKDVRLIAEGKHWKKSPLPKGYEDSWKKKK